MVALRLTAPAKLNLFLHITGKRPDGYHELESLAAFTEFGDGIEIWEAAELSLYIDGAFSKLLKTDSANNLVMKAARALQQYAGVTLGAQIRLHKYLPVGAGLGGGSCDAAVVLKGLVQLWKLSISDAELRQLALSLGSDVPVCLMGQSTWVSGIGERIMPVNRLADESSLVIVNPNVPLLTADVYRAFSGPFTPASAPVVTIESFDQMVEIIQARRNDLEAPASKLMPAITDILSALRGTNGCVIARMSGSGATCFALYRSAQEAQKAAQHIRSTQPRWWMQVTRLIG